MLEADVIVLVEPDTLNILYVCPSSTLDADGSATVAVLSSITWLCTEDSVVAPEVSVCVLFTIPPPVLWTWVLPPELKA